MSLPAARSFSSRNGIIGGVAVTASAAPLLFFLPGAEERLAMQAAKWGPRWNRTFSHITPRMERQGKKIEPRMQKGVKVVEPPFKKAAVAIDRNIRRVVEGSRKK